jgi:hypothetical protein
MLTSLPPPTDPSPRKWPDSIASCTATFTWTASLVVLSKSAATFSYYDVVMSTREKINGVPVTEEQISEWAAEAEAGYDIEALKKRGRGRPGRGAEPSQVVALRLTSEELAALDARAAREHKTRSELIRDALAAYAA